MKDSGKTERKMELVSLNYQTEMFIKGNSKKDWKMEKENKLSKMEINMKEII